MSGLSPGSAPRFQRTIMFVSVFGLAWAMVVSLGVGGHGPKADAALPDGPYSCGPTDNYRQQVQQWNGSISSSAFVGAPMTPCLSGTTLTLAIPSKDNSATISSVQRLSGAQSIRIADGSTIGNVYQLGFKGFTVNSGARNVTLTTTAGTATSHYLKIAPDSSAVFGGGEVVTDLLVDGNSKIVINDMPLSWLGSCGLLGGSGGSTCTVLVKDIGTNLVSLANMIGLNQFNIKEMDLKIYYIVTHSTTGGVPQGAAFSFPNTTITARDN